MGQVLIVRHGQADTVGDEYDRLVERGFAQCRALGASLATRGVTVDRVVRGGMRRHRESAEALIEGMGSAPEVGVDRGWDEFDHLSVLAREPYSGPPPTGRVFQQWFEAAVLRWTSGADANYPETFIEFTQRVGGALQRAAESDGTTMVVTSGGAIGWVAATILSVVGIGLLLMPVIWIINLIFSILAGMKANEGVAYRYPFALRLIK